MLKTSRRICTVLLIFIFGMLLEMVPADAEARAGRGRSFGRSSGYSSQKKQQQTQPQAAPNNQALNNNRGGIARAMAGGIAGGFLGSMLFSSLGQAAGLGGGSGGGIGILEILLLAGLAFFGFRWWKNRQASLAFGTATQRYGAPELSGMGLGSAGSIEHGKYSPLTSEAIDTETATDLFFRVQGACTKRDVSPIRHLLSAELMEIFEADIEELKKRNQINRLENISVRQAQVTANWRDQGIDFSTVRFTASLLDYAVDAASGRVIDGSDSVPVKFEEEWTFGKSSGADSWLLFGIQQV